LRAYASGSADVSDGLIADAGHVAKASGVCFVIDADKIPLSSATGAWFSGQVDEDEAFKTLISAGDDYEIVFTAASSVAAKVQQAARSIGLRVSRVGKVERGEGVKVNSDGKELSFERTGHTHF